MSDRYGKTPIQVWLPADLVERIRTEVAHRGLTFTEAFQPAIEARVRSWEKQTARNTHDEG